MWKIGKATTTVAELASSDQFWPHVKYNRAALGLRYRDVWTWECTKSESQLATAPRTVRVECVVSTDMLTPLGNKDRRASADRLRKMRQATGLKDLGALDAEIKRVFGVADVPVPYDQLKRHFTTTERIMFRMWTTYAFLILHEVSKVKGQPFGDGLCRISLPTEVSFEPFITGRCNQEVPTPFPRKPVDRVKAIPGLTPAKPPDWPFKLPQVQILWFYGGPQSHGTDIGGPYPPRKDGGVRWKQEERLRRWRQFPK